VCIAAYLLEWIKGVLSKSYGNDYKSTDRQVCIDCLLIQMLSALSNTHTRALDLMEKRSVIRYLLIIFDAELVLGPLASRNLAFEQDIDLTV